MVGGYHVIGAFLFNGIVHVSTSLEKNVIL